MELRLLIGGVVSGPWGLAASLALTYLVHSTLSVTVAALLERFAPLSSGARHACWKVALFAPLLSAGLATLGSAHFWQWSVQSSWLSNAPSLNESATAIVRRTEENEHVASLSETDLHAFVSVGLLGVGLGLLRFGVSTYRLRRRLRGRRLVEDKRITEPLARLRARMNLGPVRVTESERLSSPLVLGKREVCVSKGLLSQLTAAEVDAVLAHELSHIERGDGVWFLLAGAVQSALWFYPLNHLSCARFRNSAELVCDERAVELTESPLVLARALVRVAERASAGAPSFAPSMVLHRKQLFGRVQRLIEASPAAARGGRGRRRAWPGLLLFAAALATFCVRIAAARPSAPFSAVRAAVTQPARAEASQQSQLAAQSARMAELAEREQRILRELSAAPAQSGESTVLAAEPVRLLELEQELRHVRATQAWLEEQLVGTWLTFDTASRSPR